MQYLILAIHFILIFYSRARIFFHFPISILAVWLCKKALNTTDLITTEMRKSDNKLAYDFRLMLMGHFFSRLQQSLFRA